MALFPRKKVEIANDNSQEDATRAYLTVLMTAYTDSVDAAAVHADRHTSRAQHRRIF